MEDYNKHPWPFPKSNWNKFNFGEKDEETGKKNFNIIELKLLLSFMKMAIITLQLRV